MKIINILLILSFSLCPCTALMTQNILLEEGVYTEGLWCFPVHDNLNTYYYLPSDGRLGIDSDTDLPEFSFMRYITDKPTESSATKTLTNADGGGILHFLSLFTTPEEKVEKAQTSLREKLENDEIQLRGPIAFNNGWYNVISSVLRPDGKREKKWIGSGEAPVLENSKIAQSFELDPLKSNILLESFKMATPDVSMVFELGFSGLSAPYEAILEIDWSEVMKSETFGAGGSVYFISADVEAGFDELFRNHAINLTTVGSNDAMEGLMNTVYSKLLELMFEPVAPSTIPAADKGGLADALTSLVGANGALGSRNTTGFGLGVNYRIKKLKTKGKALITFNGRSTVHRKHFITFNIGDLHARHGTDERIFRDVPLWDPAFQTRQIHIGVDGNLEKEFQNMIQSVTVTLKKDHQNGQETIRQVLLKKQTFQDSSGLLRFLYKNHQDKDMKEWLAYQYQTDWQFQGGAKLRTQWDTTAAAMINLFTPFRRKKIELEGDPELLKSAGVRAITVKINYPFFEGEKQESQTIKASEKFATDSKNFEITLPLNHDQVDYKIIWFKEDGAKLITTGEDEMGLIFIDELPDTNN